MSSELTVNDGGMYWFLTNSRLIENKTPERRIADAVAVAGLQATAENHRRAVVLVLGGDMVRDVSNYDPATVRAYLQSIRVPLFVWSLYGPSSAAAKVWGKSEDISNTLKLEKAVAKLRAELDSQKIVWIEGRHLPQAVTLSPAAKGVELPGAR